MKAKVILKPETRLNNLGKNIFFLVEEVENKRIYKIYNANKSDFIEIERKENKEGGSGYYDTKTGKLLFEDSKRIFFHIHSGSILKIYNKNITLHAIKNGKLITLDAAQNLAAYNNFVCVKNHNGVYKICMLKNGLLHDVFFPTDEAEKLEEALANHVEIFREYILFTYKGKSRILKDTGEVSQKFREAIPVLKDEKTYFLVSIAHPSSGLLDGKFYLLDDNLEIVEEVV